MGFPMSGGLHLRNDEGVGASFDALNRALERQDVLAGRAFAMALPGVHKLAPPRERVGSPVGLLGLVADDVRKGMLRQLAREMRLVSHPIAE